jgi:hypothetical protein
VPADPQSKGGSEATVRVAKADLVPTDHNLRGEYENFAAPERACEEFMADVNTRAHRATLEPAVIRLAAEHEYLHRLPKLPHTVCFGGDPQGQMAVADLGWRRFVFGPA